MDATRIALLCFLITALLYLYNQNSDDNKPIFTFRNQLCRQSSFTTNKTNYHNKDALESALSVAAMGNNKTVIIAIVNKAYVEGDNPMLDLFLDSFWHGEDTQGLINHLLLVAVDQMSYQRCKFLRLNCYKLQTEGVDFHGEKLYMSNDFIRMMWARTLFLGEVLKRGYNFIFTDTDVLWLRNPFERLRNNIDLQISTDHFNGNPWSEGNPINTGFYMVNSNNKTVSLFEGWYARKDNSTGMKEQDVLQKMIRDGILKHTLNLTLNFLDTLYYSGFCQVSRDFRVVTSVHANCCRTINAKVADLTVALGDWKRYRSLSSRASYNHTSTIKWSNHRACQNSWRN